MTTELRPEIAWDGPAPAAVSRRLVLAGAGLVGFGTFLPLTSRIAAAQSGGRFDPQTEYPYEEWLRVFRARVVAAGVRGETWDRVMREVKPDTEVYKFDRSQPEFNEPIWRYVNRRVNEWRINTGKARIQEHAGLWDRLEASYGMDRFLMCALWGMESAFGDVIVNRKFMRPVLNCLTALAWGDQRRRKYWEQELTNAFRILDRGWAQPDDMVGSWAGAMGHTQWMPEVWLNMGVDFDRDGKPFPFGKPDDALAGTSRYLIERGRYRRGEAWGYEVRVPRSFNAALADRRTQRPVSEWQGMGITRVSGQPFPRPGDIGRMALPAGINGPAFLLLQNFFAVRSYNPSFNYSLAICHLSDRIRGGGPFVQAWPTNEVALTLEETKEMQERLTAKGFDTGGTDGRVGEMTQRAVQAWQNSIGMKPADGYPTGEVLKRLRAN